MSALFTTSRNGCKRSISLALELSESVHGKFLSRGEKSITGLVKIARKEGFTRIAIITDISGNPGTMRFVTVSESSWKWLKQLKVKRVKLKHEFQESEKIDALDINDSIGIKDLLDIEAVPADYTMFADKNQITFYHGDKEIGPRIVIGDV